MYNTQSEFAEVTGLSDSFVSAIKKGKIGKPSVDKLSKIIKGTGCNANWLVAGNGNAFPISHPRYPELLQKARKLGYEQKMFPDTDQPSVKNLRKMHRSVLKGDIPKEQFVRLLKPLRGMLKSWIAMYNYTK